MSNTRKLLQDGRRPRHTWRGYRPPRSARKRWEDAQAFRKAQKVVEVPEQQERACEEPVCQAAASYGFVASPWQHHLMHKVFKEDNDA